MKSKDSFDSEFNEAEKYWHLEVLYSDLAQCKGKSLSKREKQWLRALLLGFGPKEIYEIVHGAGDSNTLRISLSRSLYPLLKDLVKKKTGQDLEISSCRTLILLEKLGYRSALMEISDRFPCHDCG